MQLIDVVRGQLAEPGLVARKETRNLRERDWRGDGGRVEGAIWSLLEEVPGQNRR